LLARFLYIAIFKSLLLDINSLILVTFKMSTGEDTRKEVVGLIIGVGGLAVTAVNYPLLKSDLSRGLGTYLASLLGVVSMALVCAWATNNNAANDYAADARGFLDTPKWKTNPLAWHPVLMVSVFFFGQVMAILSWSLIPNHDVAKLVHVLSHTAALGGLVAGLMAIERYKNYYFNLPSLVSMHAWIGVSCVTMFCMNYAFGMFMATLTRFYPESPLRTNWKLRDIHMRFGLITLGLTTASIVSGIVNQFGVSGCFYVYPAGSSGFSGTDPNPASNYGEHFPTACKIANGLGIVVLFAALFTLFSVIHRAFSHHKEDIAPVEAPPAAGSVAQQSEGYEMVSTATEPRAVKL
jgi:hypothetical protein